MAVNRFVLNGISYHGHGAIKEIPGLIKARGYHKAFVASDPDLVKFGVTAKVTDLLKENGIDNVWLVGEEFGKTDCNFRKFHDVEEVKAEIAANKPEGFYILIKGSNGIKLFQLPALL